MGGRGSIPEDASIVAEEAEGIGAFFDQGAEATFAFLEFLISAFSFGDILDDGEGVEGFSFWKGKKAGGDFGPDDLLGAADEALFQLVLMGLPGEQELRLLIEGFDVVWMGQVHEAQPQQFVLSVIEHAAEGAVGAEHA
jgi:hypothetical protein